MFGDFNSSAIEPFCDEFMISFGLTNIVKVATCYKKSENPTTIYLILTNRKNSFQNTTVFEVGISDFHKLILTVLTARCHKAKPKIITYLSPTETAKVILLKDINLTQASLGYNNNVSLNTKFKFESISCNTIWKIIKGLDSSKTTIFKSIPIKIFSNHAYAFVEKLTSLINHCILECSFPNRLKYANISLAFKQGDKFDKHYYRPE